MKKKSAVGLDEVFKAGESNELDNSFQLMSEGEFVKELLLRFRWEVSETAIDIFRSILLLKSDLFFQDLYSNLGNVGQAPLRAQVDKIRKYERIMRKRIQHVFFIAPGFGDFSKFKSTIAALHFSAESMRYRTPKNRKAERDFSAKRINLQIKSSFYGALRAVEIAFELKFRDRHGVEFRKFVEGHILNDAGLVKVLRQGIRLSRERDLTYENFRRTYLRNI